MNFQKLHYQDFRSSNTIIKNSPPDNSNIISSQYQLWIKEKHTTQEVCLIITTDKEDSTEAVIVNKLNNRALRKRTTSKLVVEMLFHRALR